MRFLCLIYLDRGLTPGPDAMAQTQALGQAMRDGGVFVDGGRLADRGESKTVRITDDDLDVVDGPPSNEGHDTASPIAYFIIDCAGVDDALGWAARIPAAAYGSIEVRPAH